MSALRLIDNVCLWCARICAGTFLLAYLLLAFFMYGHPRLHWSPLDSERVQILSEVVILSILWILCLWNLKGKTARLFLGLSALSFWSMTLWHISKAGIIGADGAEALFNTVAMIGLPSMFWVAFRPPTNVERAPARI